VHIDRSRPIWRCDNSSSCHHGDFTVLATGHETAACFTGCYVDSWTPPADAGVDEDARILILGTGLTMVDYVLSLIFAGHKSERSVRSRYDCANPLAANSEQ
jgi:uncharacterized NAD(P)/FAD-binding protein YdhS